MTDVLRVVRRGFTQQRLRSADYPVEVSYRIGENFSAVWMEACARGAEYVLLIDEVAPCNSRELGLLLRVLQANDGIDGITMESSALSSIYHIDPEARRIGSIAWSTGKIPRLPSWLALLRTDRWRNAGTVPLTPEFFLLDARERALARTFAPRCDFDAVSWVADLLLGSATQLAADHEHAAAGANEIIPPQFQVSVPGRSSTGRSSPPLSRPPIISILCPSIRPDFLGEAIASVARQDWPHWELLIGLDGPREEHLRSMQGILAEYSEDARVRPFVLPHAGTGPTRARLASAATGDFVMAMDDDDRLPPHALARFAAAIAASSDVTALRGGTRVFGLLEAYLPPRTRHVVSGIPNDLFEVNQPWLIRRAALESLGGLEWDPGLKNAGEDSDLFLKVDRAGASVVLIDEPLYERRLSTLNQTLDCTAAECIRHIRTLYSRHTPPPWQLGDIHFRSQGTLLGMVTEHWHPDGNSVVCATQFMDFQKLGSRKDVVLDLELTSLCNAHCDFCPRETLQRSARFMSLETVQRVAESLRTEIEPLVMLCGIGESTLHPKLKEIVALLASAGARVGMTTNGSALRPELVDRLVAAGLSQINISVNARTAGTHAAVMRMSNFDEVVAGAKEIAAVQSQRWPDLRIYVSFVLTEKNAAEVEPFVEFWRHSGVSQIWLHPLTNRAGLINADCKAADVRPFATRYAGDRMVLVDLFQGEAGATNACRVARGVDFVSVDGDMLLCAQDYSARHTFGNVAQNTLEQLHHAKLLRHVRGESADTCATCTFCPTSFKRGRAGVLAVAQAGGQQTCSGQI